MNKFLVFVSVISILSSPLRAQQLSDQAEIIVLTLGPDSNELYAAFGHSAFRVIDRSQNLDRVYNYGIFDYDQPNFYLNFAKGYLNYKLDTIDYARFRYAYMYYNRFIHEQVLNLNSQQKQKVYDYLQWNVRPENQYYYYDYFYDNCATRIRDVLETTLGDQLQFDDSYIPTDYTIRELTDLYLDNTPWGGLGIDLCLGLPMDKKATPYMHMFLPDYIASAFDRASLQSDHASIPLVKAKRVTFEPVPQSKSTLLFTPLVSFCGLLVIIVFISVYDYRRGQLSKWLDIIILGVVGVVGLLFLLLWIATDHQAAARNMNLLWALPTHLIIAITLLRKKPPRWIKNYFKTTLFLSILLLVFWGWLPQLMHYALIPLITGIAIRAGINTKFL